MGNADLDVVPVKSGTRDYERVTELFKQTCTQMTEILKVYMVIQLYKIVNTKVILRLACLQKYKTIYFRKLCSSPCAAEFRFCPFMKS